MSTGFNETLTVESRTQHGSGAMRRLRRAGIVPGNLVNPRGTNASIQLNAHAFDLIMHHHRSEHLIMDVLLDGAPKKVLVREVQRHPLTEGLLHVDFQEVAMDQKMRVKVRLEVVGDAVGVVQSGGILETLIRELEVECLPADLVETIRVDVAGLQLGQSIHVSDLALPPGLVVLTAGDVAVVAVMAPRMTDEVKPEGEEATAAEPEVISKGKEEEEEEA